MDRKRRQKRQTKKAKFKIHVNITYYNVKVKEADLYSAFIEVPYTQGAQVRITQCYLQTIYTVPASTS